MNFDLEQVSLIPAEKENEMHKSGVWRIYNENLEVNIINREPVPYETHCKWWQNAFEKEFIYIILYQSSVCGYIRLTRNEMVSKEKNEISISLAKRFQNAGIGKYAYNLFETKIKNIGINRIIALTVLSNKIGQEFFEKLGFKLYDIDENNNYKRYIKEI